MGMNSFCFRPSIPWKLTDPEQNTVAVIDLDFFTYEYIFWSCVTVGLMYPALGLPTVSAIRDGTFGELPSGKVAGIKDRVFWYILALKVMGSSLFFPVLLNISQVFVCEYEGEGED